MSDLTQADIAHALDLAVGDVHQPGALGAQTKERDMSDLSTDARKALPDSAFALPAKRKFPIHDASHVRNAAARYAQNKAEFSPAERKTIERNLARAKKRFGIDAKPAGRKTRVSIKADLGHGGMLHVRHMSDGSATVRADGVAIDGVDLADKDGKPVPRVWIQLCQVGAFKGHSAGAFALTPQVFSEIVANFKRDKLPIPIDAEHASEADPTSGSIPSEGAPAMGWIHELDNRGEGGLWGLVEWLEPARTYIKEGRYRYLSPAVRFNSRDRVTGEKIGARLSSAAITNQPFLRDMAPLVAAKDADGEPVALTSYSAHEFMPRIKAALSLHPLSPHGEVRGRLDALRDGIAACGGAPGMHQGVDLMSYAAPLRTLANLPATASWPEIIDVIEDLIDAAMDQHIEEMHGGQEPDEAGMTDDEDETDGAAMRDAPNAPAAPAQETIPMANDKQNDEVVALSSRVADLEKEKATLNSLKLRFEAETATLSNKLSETEAEVAKLRDENTKLRADHAKWEQAKIEHDVDEAIASATDAEKGVFCADKRDALVAWRKNDPNGFSRVAPKPVDPSKRHLLTNVSTQRQDPPRTEIAKKHTISTLTKKLMGENKSLSFAAAQNEAARLLRDNPMGLPL